jgi:hypothetical protein
MEKQLSPHESLSIISSMIEKTRHSFSDSSHYFLLWGYAAFIGCIGQYVLMSRGYEKHYMAWWITVLALVVHIYFIVRDTKRERVSTYIGEANGYLWMGLGFSFMILAVIFSQIGWQYCLPFYVLFYALGTFVSGSMIKFRPMVFGGALSFVIAAVTAFASYEYQLLLAALSLLTSYIIPGHLLRAQDQKQTRLAGTKKKH